MSESLDATFDCSSNTISHVNLIGVSSCDCYNSYLFLRHEYSVLLSKFHFNIQRDNELDMLILILDMMNAFVYLDLGC